MKLTVELKIIKLMNKSTKIQQIDLIKGQERDFKGANSNSINLLQ